MVSANHRAFRRLTATAVPPTAGRPGGALAATWDTWTPRGAAPHHARFIVAYARRPIARTGAGRAQPPPIPPHRSGALPAGDGEGGAERHIALALPQLPRPPPKNAQRNLHPPLTLSHPHARLRNGCCPRISTNNTSPHGRPPSSHTLPPQHLPHVLPPPRP